MIFRVFSLRLSNEKRVMTLKKKHVIDTIVTNIINHNHTQELNSSILACRKPCPAEHERYAFVPYVLMKVL